MTQQEPAFAVPKPRDRKQNELRQTPQIISITRTCMLTDMSQIVGWTNVAQTTLEEIGNRLSRTTDLTHLLCLGRKDRALSASFSAPLYPDQQPSAQLLFLQSFW